MITIAQKAKILAIINVFETGKVEGNYASVSRYNDGPLYKGKKLRQVTYGRSQTTEYGNLKSLLSSYITAKGQYAKEIEPYLSKFGKKPSVLVMDKDFLSWLRKAGKDPIMISTQDEFFDSLYFQPAKHFFEGEGFTLPLSLLVIYDSYIHSGGILTKLRNQFPERTPRKGGDEKAWITAYVNARHDWLTHHGNLLLRKTNYRTQCFLNQFKDNNWKLDKVVIANKVRVE